MNLPVLIIAIICLINICLFAYHNNGVIAFAVLNTLSSICAWMLTIMALIALVFAYFNGNELKRLCYRSHEAPTKRGISIMIDLVVGSIVKAILISVIPTTLTSLMFIFDGRYSFACVVVASVLLCVCCMDFLKLWVYITCSIQSKVLGGNYDE